MSGTRRPNLLVARLALVLVGLMLGIAALEVGLRIVVPVSPENLLPFPYHYDDLARIASGDSYLAFDRDLGWAPRPSTLRQEDGAVYQTNEAGIRADREYAIEPATGRLRVAAFGDSFTHCDEVSNSECWTAQLEHDWRGTEVLNFGVPAFGPDQAWLRYQRDGRQYRPCVVLIGFMVENINRVVSRFFPFYQPFTGTFLSRPRFVLSGNDLELLPNPATSVEELNDPRWVEATMSADDRWYVPGMFVPSPLDFLWTARLARTVAYHAHAANRPIIDPQVLRASGTGGGWNGMGDMDGFDDQLARAYRPDSEALQVTTRVLNSFADQVRADGSKPVVIIFGRREEAVIARHKEDKFYAPLLDALQQHGVPTIDVSEWLARAAERRGMEQLFGSRGHYSADINAIVGSELAKALPSMVGPPCTGDGKP